MKLMNYIQIKPNTIKHYVLRINKHKSYEDALPQICCIISFRKTKLNE